MGGRTKTTRVGNGAGWNGPAKGAGSDAPMHPAFKAGNHAAKGYHDMSKSERLAALDERKWLIAMGEAGEVPTVQMMALASYEDRHLGKARQAVELSGADGSPLAAPSLTIVFEPGQDDDEQ